MRNEPPMRPIQGVAAALAMCLLAGCGPSESPHGASPQPQATAQAGEASAPVAAAREQASLPDGFPERFPLPPDLEVTQGGFTPGDAMTQANFLVRGHSETAVAELAAFFKQGLADAGFELLQSAPVPEDARSALLYFHGNGFRDCSVQLSAAGEGTDIIISLPLDD